MVGIVAEMTGYPPSCSTWTSTWRPTSAWTPSSRPRCSPRSASTTAWNATTPQAARLSHPDPRRRLDPRQDRGDHRPKSASPTPPPRHPTQRRLAAHGQRRPRRHRPAAAPGAGARAAAAADGLRADRSDSRRRHPGGGDARRGRCRRRADHAADPPRCRRWSRYTPTTMSTPWLADDHGGRRVLAGRARRRGAPRATSTSPAGERRCAAGSKPLPDDATAVRATAPSWSSPPASAATTATTRPARPPPGRRRDGVRQVVQSASGPTPWSRPSTSRSAARPQRSPTC